MKKLIIQTPFDKKGSPIIKTEALSLWANYLRNFFGEEYKILVMPECEILSNENLEDLFVVKGLTKDDLYELMNSFDKKNT